MPEPSVVVTDRRPVLPPNTPTVGGYLVAGGLTVLLFAVGFGAVTVAGELGSGTVTAAVTMGVTLGFIAGMLAAGAALVVGAPLSLVAHRLLRRVRPQWVHVLAFGVVGLATALCLLAVFALLAWTTQAWVMAAAAGVCAALSRFVVGWKQGVGRQVAARDIRSQLYDPPRPR